jgi:hypothetical protein
MNLKVSFGVFGQSDFARISVLNSPALGLLLISPVDFSGFDFFDILIF